MLYAMVIKFLEEVSGFFLGKMQRFRQHGPIPIEKTGRVLYRILEGEGNVRKIGRIVSDFDRLRLAERFSSNSVSNLALFKLRCLIFYVSKILGGGRAGVMPSKFRRGRDSGS